MTTSKAPQRTQNELPNSAEFVCLVLMQSEIELAFSLLRLAEAEAHGGNDAHARDLIQRAGATHKIALNYLDGLAVDQERHDFRLVVGSLFEAIRAVERLRRVQ